MYLDNIDINPHGNCLEVIIRIPWEKIGENRWKDYLNRGKPLDKAKLEADQKVHEAKILDTYCKTQSISRAAKDNQECYYIASTIIRKAQSQARKQALRQLQHEAWKLHQAGWNLNMIADQLDRSYETIRRWVRSQEKAQTVTA